MRWDSDSVRRGARLAAGAIFVAPFIAWFYRPEVGLIVMGIALATTSFLLHGALDAAPLRSRRWLRLLVAVNVLLMAACVLVAGWLIVRG